MALIKGLIRLKNKNNVALLKGRKTNDKKLTFGQGSLLPFEFTVGGYSTQSRTNVPLDDSHHGTSASETNEHIRACPVLYRYKYFIINALEHSTMIGSLGADHHGKA